MLHWALSVALLELDGAAWINPVSTVLEVGALLALLGWFWVAGRAGPARVRVPMLAGLLAATLARGLGRLLQPARPPAGAEPTLEALGLLLRDWLPSLLGVAALACYLVAFCGLPRRGTLWPVWPVAAGLAWGIDLAVGLGTLAASRPVEGDAAAPAWSGGLLVATRAVAVGLALALLLALLDRRPALLALAAAEPPPPSLAWPPSSRPPAAHPSRRAEGAREGQVTGTVSGTPKRRQYSRPDSGRVRIGS